MFSFIGKSLMAIMIGYFAIAFSLVVFSSPEIIVPEPDKTLSFAQTTGINYSDLPESVLFKSRTGAELNYRDYQTSDQAKAPILILIHASALHNIQFHLLATELSQMSAAQVIVPNMRGHGPSPLQRGDIEYIDQLEDDIADLIAVLKAENQNAKIILGGHSSGGGFALRMAGSQYADTLSGYIFLAPFLKYDAPTTRSDTGGWAHLAIGRFIGLSMLNGVGMNVLNHLPIMSFAVPKTEIEDEFGEMITQLYSHRMNAGFAPHDDYQADIKAINAPFLVLVGQKDDAFIADQYQPVFTKNNSRGAYEIVRDADHLGLVNNQRTIVKVADWLNTNFK
ncbi:MAG: alpha/beta fold hydrolase [Alphaproteobacteria bacterium]|nr:alpha/beta fold hydrolase [Alphaproteobacteria bacterium]